MKKSELENPIINTNIEEQENIKEIVAFIKKHSFIDSELYKKFNETPFFFSQPYETYGASGGNCWGDEAEYYHVHNPEYTKMYTLYEYIHQKFPEIEKELTAEVKKYIHQDSFDTNEFYGNYSHNEYEYLNVSDFLNCVKHVKDLNAQSTISEEATTVKKTRKSKP